MSIHLPVHMYHCSSHWADFCEIQHWKLSWKAVTKIQILMNSDKNIWHFTRRHGEFHIVGSNTCTSKIQREQSEPILMFPCQQQLHTWATMLCYTYTASLVWSPAWSCKNLWPFSQQDSVTAHTASNSTHCLHSFLDNRTECSVMAPNIHHTSTHAAFNCDKH